MSFEARCPQCVFVSRQLAERTPCLLHVVGSSDADNDPGAPTSIEGSQALLLDQQEYDEPFEFGQVRPTVDRPGPFSLREYVRLQLLRSRLEAMPSPLDARSSRAQSSRSLSHR